MSKNVNKLEDVSLEQVLKAISDPARMSVVYQLLEVPGIEKACGDFKHDLTKATFSHHIKILREAGVIALREEGVRNLYSLNKSWLQKNFPGLLLLIERENKK